MKILAIVLSELSKPDSQGRDWYGWASNQMAHAFLGVLVAIYFPYAAVQMAIIFALSKEAFDLLRAKIGGSFLDSAQDVGFWALGAWIAVAGEHTTAAIILTLFAIICGIVPRARKAVRNA